MKNNHTGSKVFKMVRDELNSMGEIKDVSASKKKLRLILRKVKK